MLVYVFDSTHARLSDLAVALSLPHAQRNRCFWFNDLPHSLPRRGADFMLLRVGDELAGLVGHGTVAQVHSEDVPSTFADYDSRVMLKFRDLRIDPVLTLSQLTELPYARGYWSSIERSGSVSDWIAEIIMTSWPRTIDEKLLPENHPRKGLLVECPDCDHTVSIRALQCPHCGCPPETQVLECPDCASRVSASSPHCRHCGCPMATIIDTILKDEKLDEPHKVRFLKDDWVAASEADDA
jgi:hypothetical protein